MIKNHLSRSYWGLVFRVHEGLVSRVSGLKDGSLLDSAFFAVGSVSREDLNSHCSLIRGTPN